MLYVHRSARPESMAASPTPVREGKMACSSCQSARSLVAKLLKADSINETPAQVPRREAPGPLRIRTHPVREDSDIPTIRTVEPPDDADAEVADPLLLLHL